MILVSTMFVWLIDCGTPFGEQEKIVEELRMKVLRGQRMKMLHYP